MEPSTVPGGSEECGSSESGWTMYIASPIHEDNDYKKDDDDDDLGTDRKGNNNDDDSDNESDDSMTSDASSGANHPTLSYGTKKESQVLGYFKHEDQSMCSSVKKSYKEVEKKTYEKRTKTEKEVSRHKASSAAGYANNGTKVRNTNKGKKIE